MLLLLCSTVLVPYDVSTNTPANNDPGVSDVPTWRVGDTWIYAGSFDPGDLIKDAGVDASVGMIGGDATTIVRSITTANIQGKRLWFTKFDKVFDKGGVSLTGYTGNVFIEYQVDEVRRVSDLAKISSDLSLYVKFVPYGISSLTVEVADTTISTDYIVSKLRFPSQLEKHGIHPMSHPRHGQVNQNTLHHSLNQLVELITQITKSQTLENQ